MAALLFIDFAALVLVPLICIGLTSWLVMMVAKGVISASAWIVVPALIGVLVYMVVAALTIPVAAAFGPVLATLVFLIGSVLATLVFLIGYKLYNRKAK